MLTVLLWILKIIGIILLSVLGLLLLLVCLVLFVPLRYEAQGDSFEALTIHAKVSWLLHIFTVCVGYEDGNVDFKIKIFGIPYQKREKKERPERKKKTRKPKNEELDDVEEIPTENVPASDESTSAAIEQKRPEQTVSFENDRQDIPRIEETIQKPNFFQKLKLFWEAIKKGLKNIRYTIAHICDKINEIRENISCYYEIFTSEYAKNAFSLCKTQLSRILRHIRPRKFTASIHFGAGDPALTGEIIGLYSMFYPTIGKNIQITPDFETAVLEGKFYMKGRIFTVVLVRVLWKLYFNEDLKKMIHVLRKDDENGR